MNSFYPIEMTLIKDSIYNNQWIEESHLN